MDILRRSLKKRLQEDTSEQKINSCCLENQMNQLYIESSREAVPKFYSKLPSPNEVLMAKVREASREMLLNKKNEDLFDHDELTALYVVLEKNASPPHGDEKYLSYLDYKALIPTLSDKCQRMLDARVFMKLLTDDPYGRVSITILFNYIMRKTWLRQTRISLSIYDETGKGYIKEHQLESYITELIPTLVQLNGMDASFIPFYVCTAVRKFFFFLDPNKTGRCKILDILTSGFIDELLDLREEEPPSPQNWFCFQSTMKVYAQYLNLDVDHNGMLNPGELINYAQTERNLTPSFVDRVFQEFLTFDGEMDYRTYLDFVIAMENPKEPQSVQYVFRVMDIDHKGYLDAFTLHYFYKDIKKMMEVHATEKISFDDVKDEIFDMVKPEDPYKIALSDLIRCGCGHTVFSVLTDFQGFWAHENREASMPDMRTYEDIGRMSSSV